MRAFFLILMTLASGTGATLSWVRNAEPEVVGYLVYQGDTPRHYTNVMDVGNVTNVTVNWDSGWAFFAVKAYTADGFQGKLSEEASALIPAAPGGLRISSRTNFVTLEWSQDLIYWEALGSFPLSNSNGFFRAPK